MLQAFKDKLVKDRIDCLSYFSFLTTFLRIHPYRGIKDSHRFKNTVLLYIRISRQINLRARC